MSASRQATGDLCGKWMPRKKAHCARRPAHKGSCIGPEGMQRLRDRAARLRPTRVVTSEDRARWRKAYRFKRYGLTHERFQAMLETQRYACAMCRVPFTDDERIAIDHDHACCPDAKRSCGRCVRALLHPRCNFIVGYVETYGDLVQAYLQSLPQTPSITSPVSVITGAVESSFLG
jgi:hypothetical protein